MDWKPYDKFKRGKDGQVFVFYYPAEAPANFRGFTLAPMYYAGNGPAGGRRTPSLYAEIIPPEGA